MQPFNIRHLDEQRHKSNGNIEAEGMNRPTPGSIGKGG